MSSLSSWWEALSGIEKVYWCFALPFTLLMILQLVFSFAAADSDVEMDHDADGSHHDAHGGSMQIFTVKNFIAFFAVMGWIGIACIRGGLSNVPVIAISFVAGTGAMLLMAWLFFRISKLTDSGTLLLQNAIGAIGEVYLTIPALKSGRGKVMVKVQGAVRELDAVTDESEPIKTGATIRVTGVLDQDIVIVTGKI